ncbi:uncharacterized protein LOC129280600 [Lytechinus pictus]|uniref:uncharacterized protein LOC129280600 n=1 Tax=Lytechinus pictus TaxID=7653 RepID=UPI0030BA23F5
MSGSERNRVRLFLWVVPRTISTALTKCLSAIEGMEVWFECFVACSAVRKQYQLATGEDIPMTYEGNEEKAQQAATIFKPFVGCEIEPSRILFADVQQKIESSDSRYILAKEGGFIFLDDKSRQYIPRGFQHVFLIRDPYKVFTSYKKAIISHMTQLGLWNGDAELFNLEKDDAILNPREFFRETFELWRYVRDNVNPNPIVLNTDDLLANPAEVLSKFCHLTGLPFSDSLLQWDASADATKKWKLSIDRALDDRIFFKTATNSSGFAPPTPAIPLDTVAPDVRRLAEASMPYFEEMNKYKM